MISRNWAQSGKVRLWLESDIPRNKLRAIEAHLGSGMTREQAAKREEISVQSYFRWRKEYGGLKVDQAKRLKEKENARLKRLVAELSLDKQMLQEVAEGNF